jgi:hypothetical protein
MTKAYYDIDAVTKLLDEVNYFFLYFAMFELKISVGKRTQIDFNIVSK